MDVRPPPVAKPRRDSTKIALGVIIVVLVAALGYVFVQGAQSNPQVDDLQNQVETLTASLNALQWQYSGLQGQYSDLQDQYDSLDNNYETLLGQYNDLQDQWQSSSSFRIGTTLATYYDYVRDHVSESGTVFEADVAAHDAGHLYWPTLEEDSDYLANSGKNESADRTAFRVISAFLAEANIQPDDSNATKIDKILRLIDSYITYEYRSNGEILFPTEVLTFRSGDCTGFSVLAACLFEEVGIKTAIGFFINGASPDGHAMVLVRLDSLGPYAYSYFSDLTGEGLSAGKWIVIEPQDGSLSVYSDNLDWVNSWSLDSATEVPYGA